MFFHIVKRNLQQTNLLWKTCMGMNSSNCTKLPDTIEMILKRKWKGIGDITTMKDSGPNDLSSLVTKIV